MEKCYVIMYGRHRKEPLFVGTETECHKWIMSQASEHIKMRDGRLLVGVLDEPDGKVYDVGQSVMYQIVPSDGKFEIGMLQTADGNN